MTLLTTDKILNELQRKLIYAKDFTPHKVAYYQTLVNKRKSQLYTKLLK